MNDINHCEHISCMLVMLFMLFDGFALGKLHSFGEDIKRHGKRIDEWFKKYGK